MTSGPTGAGDHLALDLMIVGAAKSATTSLDAVLHSAPGVTANPAAAEIGYFLHDAEFARGPRVAAAKYFATAPGSGEVRIGKSAGLMYSATALRRLHDDSPGVHAVVVLRDPVARAYSAYLWAVRAGVETDTFAAAVERERAGRDLDLPRPWLRRYLLHGEYARHLATVRDELGAGAEPGTLTVLTTEQFGADPVATADTLLAPFGRSVPAGSARTGRENTAAGVRSTRLARVMRQPLLRAPLRVVLPLRAQVALNRRAQQLNRREVAAAPMDDVTRAALVEHFAPWNRRLERELGRDLGWG